MSRGCIQLPDFFLRLASVRQVWQKSRVDSWNYRQMEHRILALDDDPNILEFYRKLFQEDDHALDVLQTQPEENLARLTAECFTEGQNMLDYYAKVVTRGQRIPLCLLDMRMPKRSGFEVAWQLRALDPEIEIIFCTAYSDVSPRDIRSAIGDRFCLVHKPFHPDELALLVRSQIEHWVTRQRWISSTAALRASELKFYRAFQHGGVIMTISRARDGVLLEVNDSFTKQIGYERDEAIGGSMSDAQIYSDPKERNRILTELHSSGVVCDRRVLLRTKNQQARIGLMSATLIQIGSEECLLSTTVDITERDEAERKLAEQMAALNAAREGIAITDPTGHYTYMNPAHAACFGYPDAGELIGKPWQFLYEPEQIADIEAKVFPELIANRIWRGRIVGKRRDGSSIIQQLSLSLLESGGIVCITSDASQAQAAEMSVLDSIASMKQASEMKARFLAMASHELRTPLANLSLGVDLLRDFSQDLTSSRRTSLLDQISKEAVKMAGMLDDLLIAARLGQQSLEQFNEWVHLPNLIDEILGELPANSKPRIQLSLDLPSPHWVIDQALCRHILLNLITNALKYAPDATPVHVRIDSDDDVLRFEVADQGIGVPDDQQGRLFDGFFRASNVGPISGTGLGLFIVRRCAELHGGSCSYTPREGGGSVFTAKIRSLPEPTLAPHAE